MKPSPCVAADTAGAHSARVASCTYGVDGYNAVDNSCSSGRPGSLEKHRLRGNATRVSRPQQMRWRKKSREESFLGAASGTINPQAPGRTQLSTTITRRVEHSVKCSFSLVSWAEQQPFRLRRGLASSVESRSSWEEKRTEWPWFFPGLPLTAEEPSLQPPHRRHQRIFAAALPTVGADGQPRSS